MESAPRYPERRPRRSSRTIPEGDAKFKERCKAIQDELDAGNELTSADANYVAHAICIRVALNCDTVSTLLKVAALLQASQTKKLTGKDLPEPGPEDEPPPGTWADKYDLPDRSP